MFFPYLGDLGIAESRFIFLYSSPDIVQDTYKGKRDACRVSVGKPAGKRLLERPQT
jgi:hypothetical protein